MTEQTKLQELKERLATIADLGAAGAVLGWDRQTYMPEGGVEGRAEQLSTLSSLSHEMFVSEETGHLLESVEEPEPDSVDAAMLRRTRRDHEKATKLPGRLVGELSRRTALAQSAWVGARENSDWSAFASHLEKIMDLQREAAEHLGYEDHPYDALLDDYEPGAKKAKLQEMFDELKAEAVPMLRDIAAATEEDRATILHGDFDEDKQEKFGREVISRFGYNFGRGRQDRVVHPFCVPIGGPGDVRITTRFDPTWLSPALFATMHESGHAMYEQGVDPSYSRTPLASGVSMGVHESQSRLWENLVGRSRGFWSNYYPGLQEAFPGALGSVSLEEFYRAANAVAPSEIRVEADEVTYNLHILIRFELEVALIEENLSVADLPEAWNAKTEEYLGFTPKNDSRGVLQDVHWAAGLFGYFPTYTIGNVLSVQIFESAVEAHPEIPKEIERGEFDTLLGWLRENIHRHGSRYEPEELVKRATGRPMETAPYLNYLKTKFGELYNLS